jgi:capsular polysaccharide transport system permease protein
MGSQDNLTSFVQNVQLVRLRGRDSATPLQPVDQSLPARLRRRLGLLVVVVAPTLITALYMFLLAAPRYESTAEFVVRVPGNGQASQIANMISGTSVIRSVDDGYVVAAYVVSRDAMNELVARDGFKQMLAHTRWDPWWRYPPLFMRDTEERLYRYFQSLIEVSYDQSTGIIALHAQAFQPQDAQRLVAALLRHSEELINTMNDRAEQDALRVAEREVDAAKSQAYQAADRMTEFRDRERIIDPMLVSNSVVKNITDLAMLVAQTNAQVAQLQKTSPQSPQISELKVKVASLSEQIKQEREQLAGPHGSLAPSIAQYDKLLLDQQFAERMFASALTSLESARVEALRQRAFVEDITQPNLPDHPSYPYKLLSILGVLTVMAMVYRIGRIFVTDTLEHASR